MLLRRRVDKSSQRYVANCQLNLAVLPGVDAVITSENLGGKHDAVPVVLVYRGEG